MKCATPGCQEPALEESSLSYPHLCEGCVQAVLEYEDACRAYYEKHRRFPQPNDD